MNHRSILIATLAYCAISLASCSRDAERAAAEADGLVVGDQISAPAKLALRNSDGSSVGAVSLSEDPNGVTIKIDAAALSPGVHGVHLHEKGLCDGPQFESAGAHLNPAGKKHGRDNPDGSHLGDLANFAVPASGSGSTMMMVAGVTMGGANALGDTDGTSLVIHAKPDDYKTDPSGASGERIACAVIAAP